MPDFTPVRERARFAALLWNLPLGTAGLMLRMVSFIDELQE
jgi:hypothetical protein